MSITYRQKDGPALLKVPKFAGALQGQRAKKGVMITTSSFTPDAWDYIKKIDNKIVLIDADELANLMIDHNLGVSTMASYEVKKIERDLDIHKLEVFRKNDNQNTNT